MITAQLKTWKGGEGMAYVIDWGGKSALSRYVTIRHKNRHPKHPKKRVKPGDIVQFLKTTPGPDGEDPVAYHWLKQ